MQYSLLCPSKPQLYFQLYHLSVHTLIWTVFTSLSLVTVIMMTLFHFANMASLLKETWILKKDLINYKPVFWIWEAHVPENYFSAWLFKERPEKSN